VLHSRRRSAARGSNAQIAACLRNAPVATLLAAQGTINTSPTAGTTILPQGLSDAFSSGNFNRVPVMQGTNLNEGTHFEPDFFDPTFTFVPGGRAQFGIDIGFITYLQLVGLMVDFIAQTTDQMRDQTVATLYPPANFPNPDNNIQPSADEALSQIYTDIAAMGIRDKPTAPVPPWQNGFAERLIGSIRRECLDHIVVFGEAHLRRILRCYARYYNDARTHRSLDKDAPVSRPVQRTGSIKSLPILGGLHHHYARVKFSVHTGPDLRSE
jgi:Integrase core domain